MIGLFFLPSGEIIKATSPPTIDSVTIATTTSGTLVTNITLAENTTTAIYVHGDVSDTDGCSDLDESSLTGVLYRSGVSGAQDCSPDNNNCYKEIGTPSCVVTGCSIGTEQTVQYECQFDLKHYAEPTDTGAYSAQNWVSYIEIMDVAEIGSNTQTAELDSLVALTLSGTLNFGSLSHNQTSTEQTVTLKNVGNVEIDGDIQPTDLACTTGYIPGSNMLFAVLSATDPADMVVLSTTTPHNANFNIVKQTDGTVSSDEGYFRLVGSPIGHVSGGTCTGTLTITGVAS